MFDTAVIPAFNSNVREILNDVGQSHTKLDRDHAEDALVLLRYKVLAWKGDGHGAQNVLEQVAGRASNLSRSNARDAVKAMDAGQLAIVAG